MEVATRLGCHAAFVLLLSGCSSTSSGTGTSGSASSYCYLAKDGSTCNCHSTDHATDYPAATYSQVPGCTATTLTSPTCCVDTDASGLTGSCSCYGSAASCREESDGCQCPGKNPSSAPVVASCTPKSGEICCLNDSGGCRCGNEQYSGSGCLGYEGRPNGDAHKVASCTAPAKVAGLCTGDTSTTTCEGLSWRPPPPPSSGSSGSSGGCTSSGDCVSSCSDSCYDCRAKSCVCGTKSSSGSCVY